MQLIIYDKTRSGFNRTGTYLLSCLEETIGTARLQSLKIKENGNLFRAFILILSSLRFTIPSEMAMGTVVFSSSFGDLFTIN